jgi:hypothetical protein
VSSDTPCHPGGAVPSLLFSAPLDPSSPKCRWLECHWARAFHFPHRLRYGKLPTQSAFHWLDLYFRRGRLETPYYSWGNSQPGHPLSPPSQSPPRQGCWTLLRGLFQTSSSTGLLVHLEKMPLTNFCNRLVFMGIRRVPNSQACGSHRFDSRDLLNPATHARAQVLVLNRPRQRWVAIAGIPNLEWPRS